MPAMAVFQATGMLDVLASSLASQLLQGAAVNTRIVNDAKHCKSRLAGHGGGSVNGGVELAGLIAGKPAPTGGCCEHKDCERHKTL